MRNYPSLFIFSVLLVCLSCKAFAAKQDVDPHAQHRRMAQESSAIKGTETKVEIPEVSLLDGNGKPHDLAQLMNGRQVVVVDFIFTTCTTICPALSAIMSSAQKQLSSDEKKDILFVSISVDPKNDTPDKMRVYSENMKAGDNWVWLTGRPTDINRALRAFGVPVNGRPQDHPPTILVGSQSQKRWYRWVGMPEPKVLVSTARNLSSNADAGKHNHAHH